MNRVCPKCHGAKKQLCGACKKTMVPCRRCRGNGQLRSIKGEGRVIAYMLENWPLLGSKTTPQIYEHLIAARVYSKASVKKDCYSSIDNYLKQIREWKKAGEK